MFGAHYRLLQVINTLHFKLHRYKRSDDLGQYCLPLELFYINVYSYSRKIILHECGFSSVSLNPSSSSYGILFEKQHNYYWLSHRSEFSVSPIDLSIQYHQTQKIFQNITRKQIRE